MSIRTFHFVFITLASLLCVFMAVWGFVLSPDHTGLEKPIGVTGCVGAVILPIYGVYFYRKIRKIYF